MSNFYCEKCGTAILDTPGGGATTFCEHYPKQEKCGYMILSPHYDNGHNGGMWCAELKPCKRHPANWDKISTKLATKNWTWNDKFDKEFTRISKGLENKGKYMEEWFINEFVTSKQVKQFISDLMVKILAEMESAKDARSCRHILKDYILKEK